MHSNVVMHKPKSIWNSLWDYIFFSSKQSILVENKSPRWFYWKGDLHQEVESAGVLLGNAPSIYQIKH